MIFKTRSTKKICLSKTRKKRFKKLYFDPTKRLNLLQESYFAYDSSNLVKQPFIAEMNKFLPIYCSVSYLTKKEDKLQIISASTQKTFAKRKKNGKKAS